MKGDVQAAQPGVPNPLHRPRPWAEQLGENPAPSSPTVELAELWEVLRLENGVAGAVSNRQSFRKLKAFSLALIRPDLSILSIRSIQKILRGNVIKAEVITPVKLNFLK